MTYDSRPDNYAHIAQVRGLMLAAVNDLIRRAHEHDASKIEGEELAIFDAITPELRRHEYGTPEYKTAAEKARAHVVNPANDHHPECHADGIHGMHLGQLLELCCDWIAASRRNPNGDVITSLAINADRFGYGPEFEGILRRTIQWLLSMENA